MSFTTTIDGQIFDKPQTYGKDSLAYGAVSDDTLYTNCTFDGKTGEWGFKASFKFNLRFENCIFKNGAERAFDMVRGGDIYFKDCKFVNDGARKKTKGFTLQKECDIGMKAGVRDVTFENCELNDLLIGDYSIYDQIIRPKARRFKFINCKNPNGGPIYVRGFYVSHQGDMITKENTSLSVFFWPAFCVQLYFWFCKKFGDKRVISPDEFIIDPREKI